MVIVGSFSCANAVSTVLKLAATVADLCSPSVAWRVVVWAIISIPRLETHQHYIAIPYSAFAGKESTAPLYAARCPGLAFACTSKIKMTAVEVSSPYLLGSQYATREHKGLRNQLDCCMDCRWRGGAHTLTSMRSVRLHDTANRWYAVVAAVACMASVLQVRFPWACPYCTVGRASSCPPVGVPLTHPRPTRTFDDPVI